MAGEKPFFQFYVADWRNDPKLRMCSLAARGLWIELLTLMHQSSRRGELRVVNDDAPSLEQIARLVAAVPDEVQQLLAELEMNGVFSRTGRGVIYSRKMIRDEKKAETARKNGRKGGNPSLSKKTTNPPSDNPPPKPHIQSPESIEKETDKSVSKKGTRLPDDWELPEADRDFANQRGLTPQEIRTEADKFRDHWHSAPGQKGVKLDWSATWRNWIRNSGKIRQEPTLFNHKGSPDADAALVNAIKSGKRFLCIHISASVANRLIHEKKVTPEECKAVGIL